MAQVLQDHLHASRPGPGASAAADCESESSRRDSGKAQTIQKPILNAQSSISHSKVCRAEDAVALIQDGAIITTSGFVGCGSPERLLRALRARFDELGSPQGLHLYQVVVTGNSKGRGLDILAAEGLVTQFTFGWTGNCLGLIKLVARGKIEAWNLPLGAVSHVIRDVAAGRPGPISRIGIGTFVDPREQGGKVNGPWQEDVVEVVRLGGQELLWYRSPGRIDVALLRGTSADPDGNISMEKEAFFADALNQVERVLTHQLPTRLVHVPGALVNKVVVAPPELHLQSLAGPAHDGSLSGEVRPEVSAMRPLPLGERKAISHRCMLEMLQVGRPGAVVNLGVGMPEGMSVMVATHGEAHIPAALPLTMSTEVGVWGGFPAGGLRFGAAHNAAAHTPCSSIIDFYNGGGIDVAVLGMAEVDGAGNVNVSKFSARHPGCGGFIDISQSAKRVVFAGTFTSGGLQVAVEGGQLRILREGRVRKFRAAVQEKTFAAAAAGATPVLYVTERCVFRLASGEDGDCAVELTEVAPGIDVEKDILAHMEFQPVMKNVTLMDARCFLP